MTLVNISSEFNIFFAKFQKTNFQGFSAGAVVAFTSSDLRPRFDIKFQYVNSNDNVVTKSDK